MTSIPDQRDASAVLMEMVEVEGRPVAVVTLNRPEARNPLDRDTLTRLYAVLSDLTQPGGPDAIVITGEGQAFSAGGDLKGYQHLFRHQPEFEEFIELFGEVCNLLERCAALTVAMVNGACVAGGLEIALACDIITVGHSARVGDGHLRFGQLPGAGGSQRLIRAIGVQRAKHWLLSARLFSAEEAVDAGLAIEAVPDELLRPRTLEIVSDMLGFSPLARQRMKELVLIAQETTLHEGLRREIDVAIAYACGTHDSLEGLDAFAERRAPRYLGR